MKTPTYEEVVKNAVIHCAKCGKSHKLSSQKFLTIVGNLIVGTGGGVIGNADWELFGVPVTHFCRECLITDIDELGYELR